jgi:hypothetical protein
MEKVKVVLLVDAVAVLLMEHLRLAVQELLGKAIVAVT